MRKYLSGNALSDIIWLTGGEKNFLEIRFTSMSRKLRILSRGGICFRACSTLSSSRVLRRFSFSIRSKLAELVSSSPRCLDCGIFLSRASGGWMGSYTAVASRPAYLSIISGPPGCS